VSRRIRPSWRGASVASALAASLLGGCAVGPNYHRPSSPITSNFKEAAGWTPSHPVDAIDKGAWWSVFNDSVLNGLEQRVAISNQTVKQYEASYREAHAVVAEARASFFPTLSAAGSAVRAKGSTDSSSGQPVSSTSSTAYSQFTAALEATWAPDLWGKIRRTVESDKALAQASAADVANARLSAQASLAEDYFDLRVLDEETRLYGDSVAAYQKLVELTKDQVREGTQPQSAVLTAQTELYQTQSSLIAVGVSRAQMEHAIAILVGVAPADLTLAPATLNRDVPVPAAGLPSTLLERRPDVAAAERQMASGNALVGVAVSAYFPDLNLSGEYGFSGSNLGRLFSASNTLWSLGANASETLLDFGLRKAQVAAARAVYEGDVANYRQTVLTALQGVEDQLAALRIYQQQEDVALKTEEAARETVKLDLDEYREGTVNYTTVIAAQAALQTATLGVLSVLESRLTASVLLIEDLGGGWNTADLPES